MVIGVAIVAAAAGAVIAGMPSGGDPFVLSPSSPGTTVPTSGTIGLASLPVLPSTTAVPTTVAVASAAPTSSTTSLVSAGTPTTSPSVVTTTEVISVAETLDRAEVRLVLANGDGRFNLVGSNAARLLELGYTSIEQDDVSQRPDATMIYVRPGFEDEALVLRDDLGTPSAMVLPLPAAPVTSRDGDGDIVAVLGPDAQR